MNLSKDVRILLERALRFARKNRYIYLTPEMLLLILLEEESFREAVDLCGGDIDALIKDLKGYLEEYVDQGNGENPEISEALSEALNMAGQSAYNSGNREIMTRHLIHGMFGLKKNRALRRRTFCRSLQRRMAGQKQKRRPRAPGSSLPPA